MFKKLSALLLACGLAVSIVPQVNAAPVEKAQTNVVVKQSIENVEVDRIVQETNEAIDELIAKAQDDAADLQQGIKQDEKQLDKIIKELQKDSKKVTNKGIKELKKLGVHGECEYIEVTIGWKTILVDPIKVVW